MIVRFEESRLEMYSQDDHADIASRIARAFREDGIPHAESRPAVIEAIRLHDRGWIRRDLEPALHFPTARPRGFLQMPGEDAVAIWGESIQAAADGAGPLGGLIVSSHFGRLGALALESPDRTEFERYALRDFMHHRARQDMELRALLDEAGRQSLEAASALLSLCDAISLKLLMTREKAPSGIEAPAAVAQAPLRFEWRASRVIAVSPWPFRPPALIIETPCRVIADREYEGDTELREAWERAESPQIVYWLEPA